MSDWQVGDLALCVDAKPCPHFGNTGLVEGVIYTVVKVYVPEIGGASARFGRCTGLELRELESGTAHGFSAPRFRKIKPDAEPCEEEFTVLIKRMKPAKVKQ